MFYGDRFLVLMYNYVIIFVEDFCMENEFQSERANFDGLWKDAIKRFFPQLIKCTLPELYDDVDCSREPEFLSKELRDSIQRPVADEHNSPMFVDELIKIFLKDGRTEWILLHIEVQGSGGDDISFRMMLYCCLIFAHHRKMPVALAILTKRRPKDEIIGAYNLEQYGTSISYKYNCFEVYALDDDSLLKSDNPFDLIFYAVKKTIGLSGKSKEEKKFAYLMQLTRLLASKGWGMEERRDIFNFIARAVNLKDKALQQKFVDDVQEIQGGDSMYPLTFLDDYFINKARDEGISIGEERGKLEANLETARRLRNAGISDNDIHMFTNLSLDEIRML